MSTGACELMPMSSFNPSEPAILHDRITDISKPGQGRKKPITERHSVTLVDGTVAWRVFEFDG